MKDQRTFHYHKVLVKSIMNSREHMWCIVFCRVHLLKHTHELHSHKLHKNNTNTCSPHALFLFVCSSAYFSSTMCILSQSTDTYTRNNCSAWKSMQPWQSHANPILNSPMLLVCSTRAYYNLYTTIKMQLPMVELTVGLLRKTFFQGVKKLFTLLGYLFTFC